VQRQHFPAGLGVGGVRIVEQGRPKESRPENGHPKDENGCKRGPKSLAGGKHHADKAPQSE